MQGPRQDVLDAFFRDLSATDVGPERCAPALAVPLELRLHKCRHCHRLKPDLGARFAPKSFRNRLDVVCGTDKPVPGQLQVVTTSRYDCRG